MNLSVSGFNSFSIFSQKFGTAGMLKSTQDKMERQQKAQSQIAVVKKQYNNEQMFHTMDEARERGEKIAELAEDYAPKTEEERKEEMVEELAAENLEVLDEAMTAEDEMLAETELLTSEEIRYKKIDILI